MSETNEQFKEFLCALADQVERGTMDEACRMMMTVACAILAKRIAVAPHGAEMFRILSEPKGDTPQVCIAVAGNVAAGMLDAAYGAVKKHMGIK